MKLTHTDGKFGVWTDIFTNRGEDVRTLGHLALAKVIADDIPTPHVVSVMGVEKEYYSRWKLKVSQVVYEINESVIVDTDELKTYVERFYKFRAQVANPYIVIITPSDHNEPCDIYGWNNLFSEKISDLLEDNMSIFAECHSLAKEFVKNFQLPTSRKTS